MGSCQQKDAAGGSSAGKESNCNAGNPGSIPGLGRSTGEGIGYTLQYSWASLMAQLVKNLPAMRETWVRSPGWEDALKKGKATHSSILVWRISWTLQFMGLQSIGFHFHIDIFQSKNMTICVSMKLQKTDFHPFSHRNKMMFWKVGICKHLFAEKKKKLCRKVFSAGRPFSLH